LQPVACKHQTEGGIGNPQWQSTTQFLTRTLLQAVLLLLFTAIGLPQHLWGNSSKRIK